MNNYFGAEQATYYTCHTKFTISDVNWEEIKQNLSIITTFIDPFMKVVDKDFAVNQPGTAKIIPEDADDLWLVYNLLSVGDVVAADTTRKVHLESAKKSTTASRVKLTLHLKVTCRDFHKDSSTVRVRGRNLDANQYVAAGSFHTLTLETNKAFELHKKIWSSDAVDVLRESSEKSSSAVAATESDADLAVVLLQQNHRAEIYLIRKGVTTLCSKIEGSSPAAGRKGSAGGGNAFFREVFAALVKHVDFSAAKSVVIASPLSTTTKDEFRRFMLSEAKRRRMKSIEENKSRIVVVSRWDKGGGGCGCGGGECELRQVLDDSAVMNLIRDSRVGSEIRALREVWDMVYSNSDRACYGPKNVESAHEMRAIETLLITDELYRSAEVGTRQKYMGLVKSVKEAGGKAFVYSSAHVSGQHLAQLTGVAAILRFPLPGLDLEEMEA